MRLTRNRLAALVVVAAVLVLFLIIGVYALRNMG